MTKKAVSLSGFVGAIVLVAAVASFNVLLYTHSDWRSEWFTVALVATGLGCCIMQEPRPRSSQSLTSLAATLDLVTLLLVPVALGFVWAIKLCAFSYLLIHLHASLETSSDGGEVSG